MRIGTNILSMNARASGMRIAIRNNKEALSMLRTAGDEWFFQVQIIN
ncbi:Flagellin [Bacillus cereus ATCC 10876]|nr:MULTISPECIES: hypothetical protein [Bacillus]MDJ0282347.1 hypothetical protein [Bacillus bombysepticus]EEK51340.1 Flagellin [Bacillus cereus ATCC 10876]KFL72477.1 putative flagellin [Bacillus cereus ATCC 10876]MBO1128813.1 hypothetical protein [Bacillus cereus]MDJ0295970.1 hypothetical protein [Bacillus bombysepticus]